jgi:hypothetical protein
MRTLSLSLMAALMLGVTGVGIADAPQPLAGKWNLNLAKSQFISGPAPKAFQRVFTEREGALDMEISGVAPDGTPFSGHSLFRMDGKDYAITGVGNADTMAVKRIDANHYETTMKKDGKVVGSVDSALSADGSVFAQAVKSATGALSSIMVFDRQ